jgi:hypothetical protein
MTRGQLLIVLALLAGIGYSLAAVATGRADPYAALFPVAYREPTLIERSAP